MPNNEVYRQDINVGSYVQQIFHHVLTDPKCLADLPVGNVCGKERYVYGKG